MAFGGPQAHVAILRDHLVVQRDWLEEEAFMELFAIGQVSTHLSLYNADDEYSHRANCILIFLLQLDIFTFCSRASRVLRVPNWSFP